jgi:hypothetical protein
LKLKISTDNRKAKVKWKEIKAKVEEKKDEI